MLVEDCLSTEEEEGKGGLSPEMIRKFYRRARGYILAYFYLEHEQREKINNEGFMRLTLKEN